MKISIGLRLFVAVLLAIVSVASLSLLLLSGNISRNFSDYALQIELDRLNALSESLQAQFSHAQNWEFLPANTQDKQRWLSEELVRLRLEDMAAPRARAIADHTQLMQAHQQALRELEQQIQQHAATENGEHPLLPPLPALPALPPEPVPTSEPHPEQIEALLPDLFARISLLDSAGRYLAGRPLDDQPAARRELRVAGKLIGYLQVTKAREPSELPAKDFVRAQSSSIAVLIALSLALSALAASLLAVHFRRPLSQLVDGSRLLAAGKFDTRLSASRSDEIGELADSFNQLADKLERAETMRRQWVADTSHELRTPLTIIRGQIEAIRDGVRTADDKNLRIVLGQISSLDKLIDELYTLARADVGELRYEMRRLNPWELLQEEAAGFSEKFKLAQVQLNLNAASDAASTNITGDPDRLRQVFANVLENAVRYTAPGGQLQVQASLEQGALALMFCDSAPAVPDEALARLGERFYRVEISRDRAQGGAGLGLALCRRIMAAHHGRMSFSHSPLGGLCVCLQLPLSNEDTTP